MKLSIELFFWSAVGLLLWLAAWELGRIAVRAVWL